MVQEHHPIVIIGAGLAGISTAIALKKQLRTSDFTIYEKASEVGGTWRDNTYPGCGSDVPGHWYSLSTELNPNWTSFYVSQPEIQSYWVSLFHKYDLAANTVFNCAVVSAEWNDEAQVYKVTVEDSITGERKHTEAQVVVWAIGGFMRPAFPKDIPGRENFRGDVFHSALWRHDINLKGKRVGVIGNGCSAAQFVPEISKDASVQVINFCRTPQWFVPKLQFDYSPWVKWAFAYIPFTMRLYRNFLMARYDFRFMIFRKRNVGMIKVVTREFRRYIKKRAPKEQHAKLIPTYPPGCKRIIVDPGYLDCLNQENVNVIWEGIDSIVENGIKLKTGEIVPLDIIIFGTGYSGDPDFTIRGRDGKSIQEYFQSQGGPTAYLGTCVPGFPNLFTLLGPNTATGHASVVFSEEVQIQYALQMIRPLLAGSVKSFEIRTEASAEYNRWLEKRLSESVWTECHSYYRVDGQMGKNVATFPGPLTLFWWLCRTPRWDHFRIIGVERWRRERR
ncbi:hypothetical protein JAAARDRAFT_32021 [Jaapia argillacea MUCL 33604]|uniref:L-ornithine N(5)-oxygenase n=1 Tax=Jaapia argillacea MUCL 33604 TaxID=933084 RepID=A0A067QEJ0_9AGAM|nr:hypothetical protein JAAARDRAFT_32021 [Jaapia argillacea MUCL 33604]